MSEVEDGGECELGASFFLLTFTLHTSSYIQVSRAQAAKYIEQGHIRVGTETITDPAYLVTRSVPFPSPFHLAVLVGSSFSPAGIWKTS